MEKVSPGDIRTITSLLGLPDLVTMRQAIMSLWSLITHPASRKMADPHVLEVILEMSIKLAHGLWPEQCTVESHSAMEGSLSAAVATLGIGQREVEFGTHSQDMFPFVLGCLWQLCFNPSHRDRLMSEDRYMVHLLEMLTIEEAGARKFQQIIVGIMWTLIEHKGHKFDIKQTQFPKSIYKLAASPLSSGSVALYCLRLLQYLYTEPHTSVATKQVLDDHVGIAMYEKLLVTFIQQEKTALERYSAAFLLSLSGNMESRVVLGKGSSIKEISLALHKKQDPD
ncbi:unnamed protein product, partial [Symbiodinium sp. KB8]